MQVLIADHNPDVRSALRLLLEHEVDMCVVQEVCRCDELKAAIRDQHPDLLLVDWGFLGTEGVAAIGPLCPDRESVKVVTLDGPHDLVFGHASGMVDGNISTREQPWLVLETVRSVLGNPPDKT